MLWERTIPGKGETSSYNLGLWGETIEELERINFGNSEELRMTVPQGICKGFLQEVMLQ